MGVLADSQIDGGGGGGGGYGLWGACFRGLVRRKQVDSMHTKARRHHQLAKDLSVLHLIAIVFLQTVFGVGSTIGARVYILVGTVAREHSGSALTLSFLIARIAAAFFSLLLCRACKSLSAGVPITIHVVLGLRDCNSF
ncbi:hypothetical protein Pint_33567 [Pistacia integerrima]|uniref:Uncharacterized protein n=1 Tax=Pistacia integerrima TaxID=434235 RepID=A0ACC0X458_9ROSI|nr:hypothetical protein Pint_33567 [Pistacia integerrima]